MPLCAIHHHHIHTTGKEREWWQERNIDPRIVANGLWQQSRERYPALREADDRSEVLEDRARQRQGVAPGDHDSKAELAAAGTPDPTHRAHRET